MKIKATVLLPTTKQRGVLLPYSVGSILQQSVEEIEVFIIGDGVDQATKEVISGLLEQDSRIRFFDHPKGPRRGEIYRHQALMTEARGEIVCYLLDRDLMLPNHVEKMYNNLRSYDFCSHLSLSVFENGEVHYVRKPFIGQYVEGKRSKIMTQGIFLFSQVGHTLSYYKKLPFGWRTTPTNLPTDVYMWQQFCDQDGIRLTSTIDSTILYFKRGDHPGLSADMRARELSKFYPILSSPERLADLQNSARLNLLKEREGLLKSSFLVKGKPLHKVPLRVFDKLRRPFLKRW